MKSYKNQSDKIILSAITNALISTYGRCFSNATANGYPKIEKKEIPNNHKEAHDFLMGLRNNFTGHRGKTESEFGIGYMLINESNIPTFKFSGLKRLKLSGDQINKIDNLLFFIDSYLAEKNQKLTNKLHDRIFKEYKPDEIIKWAINKAPNTK